MKNAQKTMFVLISIFILIGCKSVTIRGNCSFCDPIEIPTQITTDGSGSATQTQNSAYINKPKPNKEYGLETIVVENDVDVVFVNIKREFGFWTEKELRADFGSHQSLAEMKIGSFEFAYDAMPGVFYHLRDVILNEGEEKKRPEMRNGNIMDVQIEKASATKTSVTLKWWARHNGSEIKPYRMWVQSKLNKALKLR